MNRYEQVVVTERCDHRDADAEHGQHHRGHQPVQEPHGTIELPPFRRLGAHFRTSAGVIALGSFFLPARLVNDCE